MDGRRTSGRWTRGRRSVAAPHVRLTMTLTALLVGTLIATAIAAAAQPQETYEKAAGAGGAVALFPFADAPGSSTIADSVAPHTYTATNDGVTLGGEGPFGTGKSGSFGGEAYATLPSDPLAGASEFTAAMWVYWTSTSGVFNQPIFDLGSSSSNYMFLTPAQASGASHTMLFEIHTASGASAKVTAHKGTPSRWEFLTVTETSAGTLTIYQNGKAEGQSTGATISPASLGSAPTDYFGKSVVSGEANFKGSLSDAAFYTKALSAEQVEQLYDAGEIPFNTSVPTVQGQDKEGSLMKAKEGNWSGLPASEVTYQWELCNQTGGECQKIPAATGTTYTIPPEDVYMTLRVLVVERNAGGSGEAVSAATEPVIALAPKNTVVPGIESEPPGASGPPEEGQVLRATEGKWVGAPAVDYKYKWESCVKGGCMAAPGANTERTYRVASGQANRKLQVTVTEETRYREEGNIYRAPVSVSATSEETQAVTAGPPVSDTPPVLSGEAREGELLTAGAGTWFGTQEGLHATNYNWLHCMEGTCRSIPGASGPSESSYRLGSSYVGEAIAVEVTVANEVGSATATSSSYGPVVGNPPASTEAPRIEGEAREGQTVTAAHGGWSGTPPFTYTYQWQNCNDLGLSCIDIPEATASTYRVGGENLGGTLAVLVTAGNAFGSASATATSPIVEGAPPVDVQPPGIEGEAREGQVLRVASPGTWEGTQPIRYTHYAWRRCGEGGCEAIPGAGGAGATSYRLTEADVGHTIEVEVTAQNAGGSQTATSSPSAEVLPSAPVDTAAPTIEGEALERSTLTANHGAWSAAPTGYTYVWRICSESGSCHEASGEAYTPAREEVGDTVAVTVTARNSAGSTSATSASVTVLERGGAAVGWGEDHFGQLGTLYQASAEFNPVDAIEGLDDITRISGGLALLNNGTVAAFGGGFRGELGDDGDEGSWEEGHPYVLVKAGENPTTKTAEGTLTGVKAIAGAGTHRLALLKNGHVLAWGNNQDGELGQGLETHGFEKEVRINQKLPKEVKGLSDVTKIAAGGGTDYALTAPEGAVMAWGEDRNGQLGADETPERCKTEVTGNGKTEACSAVPVPVEWENPETKHREALTNVTAVYGGEFAAYAIREGKVIAWGNNSYGQLGTGAATLHSTADPPAYVVTPDGKELENVVEVAAGYQSALARLKDGEIYGWGETESNNLPGIAGENCAHVLTQQKREEREKRIAEQRAEIEVLLEEIKAGKEKHENVEGLEEALKTDRHNLKEIPDHPCVKVATPDEQLDHALNAGGAEVEEVSIWAGSGAALSSGKVFTWGTNAHGEQGNGSLPAGTIEPITGKRTPEAGYPVTELQGIGPAREVSAGKAVTVLLDGASTPKPLFRVVPGPHAINLYWQKATADGDEKLEGETLTYRPYQPGEVHPDEDEPTLPGAGELSEEAPPFIFNSEEETLEGRSPVEGERLVAEPGEWTGGGTLRYQYQWQQCAGQCAEEASWHDIEKASKEGYTVAEQDVGHYLRIAVTVTGTEGEPKTAFSAPTGAVVKSAGEAGEAFETVRINLIEDPPEELPEEVFRIRLTSTRSGEPLEAAPYEVAFTSNGKHTKAEPPEQRIRRMVVTPLE